ncbi:MAG: hypothetical protein SAJ72_03880 [Jaaginema sp. PMC 1080.18]|nr:hypothetical protein [Jaaginema sp. PMC 1080.18]
MRTVFSGLRNVIMSIRHLNDALPNVKVSEILRSPCVSKIARILSNSLVF